MENYARRLPKDEAGNPLLNSFPNVPANQVNLRENGAASSVWALGGNTTAVQVTTSGSPAAIKWAGNQAVSVFGSVGGMAWDVTVPANATLYCVVPRSVAGIANWNANQNPSIVGANQQEGLYPAIATRSLGVGSVLLTEY